MSAWLEQLFTALSPLWRMSLTGAYVAGIVFFLRLLLKGRAPRQAVCLLWLLVFARLLVPLSLQSPFSAVPQALAEGARPAVSQSGAQQAPAPILENNPAVPRPMPRGTPRAAPRPAIPPRAWGRMGPPPSPRCLSSPERGQPGHFRPAPAAGRLPLAGAGGRGVAGGGGRHAGLRPALLAAAAPPPL